MATITINDGLGPGVEGHDASDVVDHARLDGVRTRRHVLRVDFSERHSALLDLARTSADFDVHLEQLAVGDYFVDGGVVVERKTYADFAMSLVDGRFFPQAAALARSPHRPVMLLEGPRPRRMPDVHPHALKGAIVSLAVMWRLPVIHARGPEDSLYVLRCLADQLNRTESGVLQRYDRKPKRLTSKKIYMLQGLPGVGPALANRRARHTVAPRNRQGSGEVTSRDRAGDACAAAPSPSRGHSRQRAFRTSGA